MYSTKKISFGFVLKISEENSRVKHFIRARLMCAVGSE